MTKWREELKRLLIRATAVDQHAILLISNVDVSLLKPAKPTV
jgi:hypothetical protein